MMDKEKILEEGLLELYLLGELDAPTHEAVNKAIASDDELNQIVQKLEENLEVMGLENAMAPPAIVKTKLMDSIAKTSDDTKVVSLKPNKYKAWFSLAAAASVILFLNSIFLIVQNGDIKQQLSQIQTETDSLKDNQEAIESAYDNQQMLLAFLSDPTTEQYLLTGNAKMPEARLVSYVNHNNKTVMINTTQLSELSEEQDYQMWADVEGEMINMGVIELEEPLLAMNYIDHAESFNVTIEPKGGSEHPTVSNLISNTYLR